MRTVLIIPLLLSLGSTIAQAQDAANGEKVFAQCRACHQIGPTAKNAVGPILNGLIGRKAGTVEGYNYSPANKNSGITWDEAIVLRVHQGSQGQGARHQDDLRRAEGRAADQGPARLPQAI